MVASTRCSNRNMQRQHYSKSRAKNGEKFCVCHANINQKIKIVGQKLYPNSSFTVLTSNSLKQVILIPTFSPASFSSSVTEDPIFTMFFNLGHLSDCSSNTFILLSSQTTVTILAANKRNYNNPNLIDMFLNILPLSCFGCHNLKHEKFRLTNLYLSRHKRLILKSEA